MAATCPDAAGAEPCVVDFGVAPTVSASSDQETLEGIEEILRRHRKGETVFDDPATRPEVPSGWGASERRWVRVCLTESGLYHVYGPFRTAEDARAKTQAGDDRAPEAFGFAVELEAPGS